MDLAPLLEAPSPIPAHALAAWAMLLLGGLQLALPRGTRRHVWIGRAWVLGLGFVAASGLFIHSIRLVGPFSPLHLLSLYTLLSLVQGVRAARAGDIAGHRRTMTQVFALALVVAGLFTFLPGRTMNAVLLGG